MARFYGKIGFGVPYEPAPGVWDEKIEERFYSGELIRNTRRLQTTDKVNYDLTISNELSIIADPYIECNLHSIRYVEFMGAKWKISSVDVQYPRLNLTLGGLYNEQTT